MWRKSQIAKFIRRNSQSLSWYHFSQTNDFACTDMHHTTHLEAMKAHFTADSLKKLYDEFGLKNHELAID